MPVTLLTGGLLGLVFLFLSYRVSQVRRAARVSLGDGGDADLLARIRAHANFAEYVPFCLILILGLEMSTEVSPPALWVAGLGLVGFRIAHAIGMARGPGNIWRVVGTAGTWIVLLGLSLWAVVRALGF